MGVKRFTGAAALVGAVVIGAAVPAVAGIPAPEKGKYGCIEKRKVLKLTSRTDYVWAGDRDGEYAYKKKTGRLNFKSGPLDKFYGHHAIDVFTSIDLFDKKTRKFRAVCVYKDPDAKPVY